MAADAGTPMVDGAGEDYEAEHVHQVYEQIASHFSSTRYKPWPVIKQFLEGLPPGAVGLDVGCGNGKYLAVNPSVFIVASDRSPSLVQFASAHQPHSAVVADILALPHQQHTFDFAISIAVLHHLSTPERRIESVAGILETLKPGGRALLYVWALEQKNSRRGWDDGNDQDVMVPWVMRGKKEKPSKKDSKHASTPGPDTTHEQTTEASHVKTFHRYYHLYRKGELDQVIEAAGGVVVDAGYDQDNWWAIAQPKPTTA